MQSKLSLLCPGLSITQHSSTIHSTFVESDEVSTSMHTSSYIHCTLVVVELLLLLLTWVLLFSRGIMYDLYIMVVRMEKNDF
jgi:hypothetical protein